ncbi:MAG: hypothetical protein VR70_15580 [Rhodospirillaceae bacterium BRH_c57]|nr:MAG: hypothetical protein VR70_15580 [Rhodospirillaceae bacterium BRH_c57]
MTNRNFLIACAILGLAACSSGDRVVLMPDPDGHVGRVEVSAAGGTQELTQARSYSRVRSPSAAPSAPAEISDQDIAETWGEALGALPPRPQTILLYFRTGSSDLRDESVPEIPRIAALLREWEHPHVMVVGHADGTGSDAINIVVSRERAAMVRDMLVDMGVPGENIEVNSHGKRNPLIPVPDGVSEPRNRRVSVTIQ